MFYKSLSNFRSYIYYGIRIGANTNRTFNNLIKFNNYNNNNNIRFISNNFNKQQQNNDHQQQEQQQQHRKQQQQQKNDLLQKLKIRSTLYYVIATGVLFIGCTYAAVPLYRMFCQAYSYGGTVQHGGDNVENMKTIKERVISIKFNADVSSSMRWNFRPQQYEIKVVPGETALAFYTAKNPADTPVIGISTYNVVPFEAGQYFNKIQCFCFEEQQLNPHEEVDMPVFFYIDPEFVNDPKMEYIDEIMLSYTFFESKPGMKLPIPNYLRGHSK